MLRLRSPLRHQDDIGEVWPVSSLSEEKKETDGHVCLNFALAGGGCGSFRRASREQPTKHTVCWCIFIEYQEQTC